MTATGTDELGMVAGPLPAPAGVRDDPDPAAVAREALRLRVRWLQELTARAAWELAHRLVAVGVLPSLGSVRLLTLDELAQCRPTAHPAGRPRRSPRAHRDVPPLPVPPRRRRHGVGGRRSVRPPSSSGAGRTTARPASAPARRPARVVVWRDGLDPAVTVGAVLVVGHLDPRLAPLISRLGALVAETGSALSHLAILAREYHVPTVVGVAGATTRFRDGEVVTVDGERGHRESSSSTDVDDDHRINSPSPIGAPS